MKKFLLIFGLSLFQMFAFGQAVVAPPLVLTDCEGGVHDLHSKLDNGKIIVIGWAMPCLSCAAPLLDVHNATLNYAISNPGVVEYWVADDFANTDCVTLRNWALSNGINQATFFSTAELDMYDFGDYGMPKVIVLGCGSHEVYYDANFTPTGSGVTAAVDQILTDISNSCLLGLNENSLQRTLEISPNPATDVIQIKLPEDQAQGGTISIYNEVGAVVQENTVGELASADDKSVQLDISGLRKGIYLLKFNRDGYSATGRFVKISE